MSSQPSIIKLNIEDKNTLRESYMPFVENGGLFVQTTKSYRLGDEVMVMMTLMEERLPMPGHVIWVTPQRAQGKQVRGVGIQLTNNQDGSTVKRKIEAELAGSLNSANATRTM